jgi:hypothetical protein
MKPFRPNLRIKLKRVKYFSIIMFY